MHYSMILLVALVACSAPVGAQQATPIIPRDIAPYSDVPLTAFSVTGAPLTSVQIPAAKGEPSEAQWKLLGIAYIAGSTLAVAGGSTLLTSRKREAFIGGVAGGAATVVGLVLPGVLFPSRYGTANIGLALWPPVGAAAGAFLGVQLVSD
jgi:hypothetical protein